MACVEVSQPPNPRSTSAATSSSQPVVEHRARRGRRSAVQQRLARHPSPAARTRSAVVALPRLREGRERPAGDRRHLQGPHGPAHVGRLDLRGRDRVRRRQALVQPLGRPAPSASSLQLGPRRGVGSRELEVVHDRAEVEARTRRRAAPACPRASMLGERRPGRSSWNRATRERLRRARRRRSGGAGRAPARPREGLAVPTSIPRYTSIESTETISASERLARARARPRSCPTAVGPTSASGGRGSCRPPQTATASGDGTSSPVRWCGGGRRDPGVDERPGLERVGARCTIRLVRVRACVDGPRFARPLHQHLERARRPARASARARSAPAARPAGRTAPARPPSGPGRRTTRPRVPGRGEYWNVYALSNRARSTTSQRLARSPPRSRRGTRR